MVLEEIPLPESWRGSAQAGADQEHKRSSKQVPAQAKPWPIGSTGEGGRELGMEREKHKPAWKESTEEQDRDAQG